MGFAFRRPRGNEVKVKVIRLRAARLQRDEGRVTGDEGRGSQRSEPGGLCFAFDRPWRAGISQSGDGNRKS